MSVKRKKSIGQRGMSNLFRKKIKNFALFLTETGRKNFYKIEYCQILSFFKFPAQTELVNAPFALWKTRKLTFFSRKTRPRKTVPPKVCNIIDREHVVNFIQKLEKSDH